MAEKTTKKSKKVAASPKVRVKSSSEVMRSVQRIFEHNVHGRYNVHLSKRLQKKAVSYGPWLAGFVILVALPQLLALAKTGNLISVSGFFETILFNQSAWVILIILFINVLLFVDGLSAIFEQKRKGWDRIYASVLLSGGYILWQLIDGINQPAAPILSLIAIFLVLFTLLDIRSYYR